MSTVEKSITVDVPVRTAYDQWTQFEEFPEFMEHVEHVRQLDQTSLRWTVKIGDADRSFDAEVTEQTPDQRIAWKATGDTRHAGVVTFHYLDDECTKIMLQLDVEPTDWVEKIGDFVGAYSASVEGDLQRFKTMIEERGHATGGWRGTITRDGQVKQPDEGSQGHGSTAATGSTAAAAGSATTSGTGSGSGGRLASTGDTTTRDEVPVSDQSAPAAGGAAEDPLAKNDLRTT